MASWWSGLAKLVSGSASREVRRRKTVVVVVDFHDGAMVEVADWRDRDKIFKKDIKKNDTEVATSYL